MKVRGFLSAPFDHSNHIVDHILGLATNVFAERSVEQLHSWFFVERCLQPLCFTLKDMIITCFPHVGSFVVTVYSNKYSLERTSIKEQLKKKSHIHVNITAYLPKQYQYMYNDVTVYRCPYRIPTWTYEKMYSSMVNYINNYVPFYVFRYNNAVYGNLKSEFEVRRDDIGILCQTNLQNISTDVSSCQRVICI